MYMHQLCTTQLQSTGLPAWQLEISCTCQLCAMSVTFTTSSLNMLACWPVLPPWPARDFHVHVKCVQLPASMNHPAHPIPACLACLPACLTTCLACLPVLALPACLPFCQRSDVHVSTVICVLCDWPGLTARDS